MGISCCMPGSGRASEAVHGRAHAPAPRPQGTPPILNPGRDGGSGPETRPGAGCNPERLRQAGRGSPKRRGGLRGALEARR